MATNEIFRFYPMEQGGIACSSPAVPAVGGPVRYGELTGIALTLEAGGGNPAGQCTVDFGMGVWSLPVNDHVGGGIAPGDQLFLVDGAPATIENDSSGRYFGVALGTVGAGNTTTINVLHLPAPGAGTVGAGTIATVALAAGILSADAAGRAKFAANFFDAATVLAKFDTDSFDAAELLKLIKDGAFAADAATRALFGDGIWTEAKLEDGGAAAGITSHVVKHLAAGDLIAVIPIVYCFDMADGASDTHDFALTYKTQITDCLVIKTDALCGANANTVQLQTAGGAANITNAMDQTGNAVGDVERPTQVHQANGLIAAGGTLRFNHVKAGGNSACRVIVYGYRSA